MRRLFLTTAVAVGIFALACTDDERQQGPTGPASTASAAKVCPSLDPIQKQICALFKPTDNLASASDFYSNIKTKKQQGRTADAQARAVDLVNFTFKLFYEGKLLDPTGNPDPTTAEAAVKLSCDVYAFVSTTVTTCPISAADLSTTLGPHSTLQACGPAGCLALPPDKHSGVSVPKDALLGPAFIKVDPLPATFPRGGPLNTPKDQYLLFRQLELLGFDHFEKNVLVGICHLDPGDGDFAPPNAAVDGRLKLAHNVTLPNETETIEEFDRVAAPFLICSDFNSSDDEVPTFGEGSASFLQRQLGSASRALGRNLVPILENLLPEPAEAAVLMGSCCLGGSTSRLSPWGAVDSLSGQEVRFFQDDGFGDVAFDPGDKTFFTGTVISWQVPIEGSQFITAYPAVQVVDPTSGEPRPGVNVTVSLIQVDGSGTLGGTLTQSTSGGNAAAGPNTAVFDNLTISEVGTYRLRFTFTAPGLPNPAFIDSGTFSVQSSIQ